MIIKNTHCGRCGGVDVHRINIAPRRAHYMKRKDYKPRDYKHGEVFAIYTCKSCCKNTSVIMQKR